MKLKVLHISKISSLANCQISKSDISVERQSILTSDETESIAYQQHVLISKLSDHKKLEMSVKYRSTLFYIKLN